jgi:hypothetical protein
MLPLPVIKECKAQLILPVLGIWIRRIRMFLGLPDPDSLVRGINPDPDPSLFHKCVERTEEMLDKIEF